MAQTYNPYPDPNDPTNPNYQPPSVYGTVNQATVPQGLPDAQENPVAPTSTFGAAWSAPQGQRPPDWTKQATSDFAPNPTYSPPTNTDSSTQDWWTATQDAWKTAPGGWTNPGMPPPPTGPSRGTSSDMLTGDAPPGSTEGAPTTATPTTPGNTAPTGPTTTPPSGPPGTYANIPGFDLGKLQDPTHQNSKYTPAVRAFSQAIGSGNLPPTSASLPAVVAYAQSHGFPNAKVTGSDSIDYGDGWGPIDVITDVGGPGAGWWFANNENATRGTNRPDPGSGGPSGHGEAGHGGDAGHGGLPTLEQPTRGPSSDFTSGDPVPGMPSPITGPGGGPSQGPTGPGQYGPGTGPLNLGIGTGSANSLYDLLMRRATQSLQVNSNDPIIRNQSDAFNAQQDRAARNYLQANAERVGPNSNVTAETRSAAEKVGQNTSAFEAQLMGQELTARRQEIQQALSGASGLLTAEQALALQRELQLLNLAASRYQFDASLGQRASEFDRTLGQNAYQFDVNDRFRNSPLGSS